MVVYGGLWEFAVDYGSTTVNSRLFVCMINSLCLILRSEISD